MSNLSRNPNSTPQEQKYKKSIYEALYPRWDWSGGYIIANVFDNGKKIVLEGYQQPSSEESDLLIRKIENCLDVKTQIFWKLRGSDQEISLTLNQSKLILNQNQLTLQEQVTKQLNNLLMAIYAKANQDIETVKKMPVATIEGLGAAKDCAFQYSQQGFLLIQANYNQIIDGSIKVIEPLRQELIKYPNDWILNFNQNINIRISEAKADFDSIKIRKEGTKSDEIATFVIIESLKKSTFSRLVDSGIYHIGKSVSAQLDSFKLNGISFPNDLADNITDEIRQKFEQPKTSDLMLIMIIQIACAYERANFSSTEKQKELVSIVIISYLCSLAVDADFADLRETLIKNIDFVRIFKRMGINDSLNLASQLQTGIEGTKNLNSFQQFFLSIIMNMALFLVVGFVAKYVYKNYDDILQVLASISMFNQIKNEASQSVLEIAENTVLLENVIVECYQIEKIEIELTASLNN